MKNVFLFVYQRAGTKLLTDLLESRTANDWEKAKILREQGIFREPIGHVRCKEDVSIEHVTGPNLLDTVSSTTLRCHGMSGTRVWYTYIWNWWGETDHSSRVPGPYDGVCLFRWGPNELLRLPGDWQFFVQVRDLRNHIQSVRTARGEKANPYQIADPQDYFKTLCLGQRNRSQVVLDCNAQMRNYHIVRFEDLVADPVPYVGRLISAMGLTPDESAIRQAYQINQDKGIGDWHSSFKSASTCNNRWEQWTPEEKAIFKKTAGGNLVELGYAEDLLW
jgi:hypothetical protein